MEWGKLASASAAHFHQGQPAHIPAAPVCTPSSLSVELCAWHRGVCPTVGVFQAFDPRAEAANTSVPGLMAIVPIL